MPGETGAAEYQDAVTGFDRLRGGEALFKIQRVIEKVRARREQVAVNGPAHPIFLEDDIDVLRVTPPPRQKLLPRGLGVRGTRPHRLDLDVKVVGAAIDDEVDLAPVRQQIRLICDGPGDLLIY